MLPLLVKGDLQEWGRMEFNDLWGIPQHVLRLSGIIQAVLRVPRLEPWCNPLLWNRIQKVEIMLLEQVSVLR